MVAQVKPTLHLPKPKAKAQQEPKQEAEKSMSHEEARRQLGQFLIDPSKVDCSR